MDIGISADKVKIIVEGEDKASNVFGKVGDNLGKLKGVALGVGAAIVGAFAGIGAVIAGTVPKAIEFDKAMRNVNAIAQLSEEEFQQLSSDVLDFSKTTRASAVDVAGSLYNVVSAGYDTAEGFEVMTASSRAAGAGLAETESTSKLLIAALRSYQLPVSEANAITDIFLHTVNQGITTLPELATGLGRVMPVASSLGVGIDELGFSVARMTQTGLSTDEAVTRLQATFTSMLNPTEALDEAVQSLGYTSGYDLVQQSGGALGALRVLKEEGFLDTTEEAANLFNNVRALGGVMALTADDATLAADAVTTFGEQAEGAVERARVEQYKSFAAMWEKFKSTLEVIAIEVGKPVMDFMAQLLGIIQEPGLTVLEPFVELWGRVWEWLSKVLTLLQGGEDFKGLFTVFEDGSSVIDGFFLALGFGEEKSRELAGSVIAIVDALFGLWDWMTITIIKIGELVTPIWEWIQQNIELKDVLITLGIIIGGFAAVILVKLALALAPIIAMVAGLILVVSLCRRAWEENWLGIRDKLTEAWENHIRPAIEKLWEWLQINIPLAIERLKEFWEDDLLPALKTVWDWIENNLIPALIDIRDWLQTNIPLAIEACRDFWEDELLPALEDVQEFIQDDLIPEIEKIWEWLKEEIPEAIETCRDFWEDELLPALEGVWAFIQDDLIPIIEDIWDWLKTKLPEVLQSCKDEWESFKEKLSDVWDFINEYIVPIFLEVSRIVKAVLNLALIICRGLWERLKKDALEPFWDFMERSIIPIIETCIEKLDEYLSPALETATGWWDKIKKALDPIKGLLSGIAQWLGTVADVLERLPDHLPSWLTSFSPTPFERGLRGIHAALELVNPSLREFNNLTQATGRYPGPVSAIGAGQRTEQHVHYHLSVSSGRSVGRITDDFDLMSVVAR